MNQYIQKHKSNLDEVVAFFKKDIASIRTGRANPAMFDGVMVESYGTKAPLQQVGNIAVVDARCLTITPWDKNTLKEIEEEVKKYNDVLQAAVDIKEKEIMTI